MPIPSVVEYYDECHGDYKRIWGSERNLSLHYGLYEPGIRTPDEAAENMNRHVAKQARIQAGDCVLDAGCGIGGTAFWLAENRGARVVGLNIQPMHVERARRAAAGRGLDGQVRFERGDFARMPFDDGEFDVVLGLESFCHADSKDDVARETARVLAPGGRLAMTDYFLVKPALSQRERRGLRLWLDGWALPSVLSVDDFGALFEKAGLESVHFEDLTSRVMPDARRMHRAAVLTAPLTGYREWTGRRSVLEARNRQAARWQYRLLRRGVTVHGLLTGHKPAET